jgi:hypothetical protein
MSDTRDDDQPQAVATHGFTDEGLIEDAKFEFEKAIFRLASSGFLKSGGGMRRLVLPDKGE